MSVVSSQEALADALKAGIGGLTYKEPMQGVFAECTAAVAELKTDEVAALEETQMEDLLESLANLAKEGAAMYKEGMNWQIMTYGTKQKQIEELVHKLSSVVENCQSGLKILQTEVDKKKLAVRRAKEKETYALRKHVQKFKSAGLSMPISESMGMIAKLAMENPFHYFKESSCNAESFEHNGEMLVFTKTKGICRKLSSLVPAIEGKVAEKRVQVIEDIKKKKSAGNQLMVTLAGPMKTTIEAFDWAPFPAVDGDALLRSPMVLGVAKYRIRVCTKMHMPHTGIGSLVGSLDGAAIICVLPAKAMTEFPADKLESALEHIASSTSLRAQVQWFALTPGQTVWIPYGCIWWFTTINDEVATLLQMPYYSSRLREEARSKTKMFDSLVGMWQQYLQRKSAEGGKPWSKVDPEFKKWLELDAPPPSMVPRGQIFTTNFPGGVLLLALGVAMVCVSLTLAHDKKCIKSNCDMLHVVVFRYRAFGLRCGLKLLNILGIESYVQWL